MISTVVLKRTWQQWRQVGQEWLGVLLITPAVAIAVIGLSGVGVLQWLEWATLDQVLRLRPEAAKSQYITLVTIDETDLDFARQLPISDYLLAQMIYNLSVYDPKAIGLTLYRDLPVEPGREALARVFQEHPNVIGIEKVLGDRRRPLPILQELEQVAPADLILDWDGEVRRGYLSLGSQGSLGAKLAKLYFAQMDPPVPFYRKEQSPIQNFVEYQIGDRTIETLQSNARGYVSARNNFAGDQILLHYRGGLNKFDTVSFQDVLENQVSEDLIRDRLILVGMVAPSQNEAVVTPYSSRFLQLPELVPSVVIHATLADQLLSYALDGRPLLYPIERYSYNLLIFLWTAIAAGMTKVLMNRFPSLVRGLVIGSGSTAILLILNWGLSFQGLVIPVFTPWLASIFTMALTTGFESQKQLRRINKKLEAANQKLADYSQDLEATVGDRTKELSAALKDLQTTQTNLIQAEKMAALGQMVAGIAHEMNNPITFISGNVRHAEEYFQDLLDIVQRFRQKYHDPEIEAYLQELDLDYLSEDFSKLLQSIQNGALRISDIVKSLKTFSRLDEAALKQIDLKQDLESVLFMVKNRFEDRGDRLPIHLKTDIQATPLVQCYPAKINQVLLNLLNNAVDAVEDSLHQGHIERGEVLLRICPDTPSKHQVRIQIIDNGLGVPDNLASKIFDPFFTTKPVGQGTGLGLAIAHTIIVEQHQGALIYNKTEDNRTQFTVILPVKHSLYTTRPDPSPDT